VLLQDLDLPVEDVHRRVKVALKPGGPLAPHQGVGILSRGEAYHGRVDPLGEQGIPGAEAGLQTRPIRVVQQQGLSRIAANQTSLIVRQAGAEGSHGVLESRRRQGHDVHVALYHERHLLPPNRVPRAVKAVQRLSLVVDRRLG
jgi:hypothetical protein